MVLNVDLTKMLKAGSVALNVKRDLNSNSYGGLNQTDSIGLTLSQKLTDRLSSNVSINSNKTESVSGSSAFSNNEIILFKPGLTYMLSSKWSVRGSYRYIKRSLTNISSNLDGSNNTVYIEMNYNFPIVSTF